MLRRGDAVKPYRVNEIFYSLQGEGIRAGTANVFVRFSGCNLRCAVEPGPKSPGGFDCDTESESGRKLALDEIHREAVACMSGAANSLPSGGAWLILTGGEPGLQVDTQLIDGLHERGWKLAIETNGSVALPPAIDWITVSPKVAEHAIRQRVANEVKYVRGHGQAISKTVVEADHYLITPAFNGMVLERRTLDWCIGLVKENPRWRLSLQQHKAWQVR